MDIDTIHSTPIEYITDMYGAHVFLSFFQLLAFSFQRETVWST